MKNPQMQSFQTSFLMRPAIIAGILLATFIRVTAQIPPTILRSEFPPDISEKYSANPKFYEVMSAFPDNNSYTRYKFDEVKKTAGKDPEAMVILGDHYRIGRSTPVDYKKALKEYQRAAAKGYARANHRIAYMYADGLGLPKDQDKVMEFIKKSADGGYDVAQYDYALIYLNGKFNQPKDYALAYTYLMKASKQGHRLSNELLGMLSFHPGAPGAGVPAGFETSLKYFRMAGDTDGERALREKIGTFGGLRYYLRVLPGFIPGVDETLDPTDFGQGIKLIRQLESQKRIIGDELYEQYRNEIAENMLYAYYFKAQGEREALLRFLIAATGNSALLAPYLERYLEAASRDFRLTVQFHNLATLQSYIDEFRQYQSVFQPEEFMVVADRVFVALWMKEPAAELQSKIITFFKQENWILTNLSSKYIYAFEQKELAMHQEQIVEQPYNATGYITELFNRYSRYRNSEIDTLHRSLLPEVRMLCIHPVVSDQLIVSLKAISARPMELMLAGLNRAAEIYHTEINTYFARLNADPASLIGVVNNPTALQKIVSRVKQVMLERGSKELDKLCAVAPHDPQEVLAQLKAFSRYQMAETGLNQNKDRRNNLYFNCLIRSTGFGQIVMLDPNGVAMPPEIAERKLAPTAACADDILWIQQLIKHDPAVYTSFRCEVFNHQREKVTIRIMLIPSASFDTPRFDPSDQNADNGSLFSNWVDIAPGEKITLTIPVTNAHQTLLWIPVIELKGEQYSIPHIRRNTTN